jgi:hypothetical protein
MSARALRYASVEAMPEPMQKMIKGIETSAALPAHKYHNQPTVVDGIRFESKREARYYEQLKVRKALGEVQYWLRQVSLHLPGGTRYIVDFLVFFHDPARKPEYVDVKGRETQVFRLKRREIEHHYPIKIKLA